MITQIELKKHLSYNPETGIFTRLTMPNGRIKIGDIAGSKKFGYIVIRINKKQYRAHHLAWLYIYGYMPKCIDHIDHNRSNNKIENLREASTVENNKNRGMNKNNTSGITGVGWAKDKGKWVSQIQHQRKNHNLGYYEDKFEAICARKSAETKFGFHENHGK